MVHVYKTLDLLKFIMSFLVIAIHTHGIVSDTSYWGMDFIWKFAVPIFFLISGFFLQKSYITCGGRGNLKKLDKYIYKSIKLYLLYTLIYLPITIIGFSSNNQPVWKNILIFIKGTLLVGENYFSWPLWYLLALIVSAILLRILLKYNFKVQNIFFLGIILTCIGLGIQHLIDNPTGTFLDLPIKFYKLAFNSTRNGFFVGFGYVSTGFLIAYYESKLSNFLKLEYLFFIFTYILYLYKMPLALNIASTLFFCIFLQKNIYKGNNNVWLRNMSTLIYFFHMYFVFLFKEIFRILDIELSFILSFILISALTVIFSSTILYLSKKHDYLKKLLGQ